MVSVSCHEYIASFCLFAAEACRIAIIFCSTSGFCADATKLPSENAEVTEMAKTIVARFMFVETINAISHRCLSRIVQTTGQSCYTRQVEEKWFLVKGLALPQTEVSAHEVPNILEDLQSGTSRRIGSAKSNGPNVILYFSPNSL
jgi:hypothetical protein